MGETVSWNHFYDTFQIKLCNLHSLWHVKRGQRHFFKEKKNMLEVRLWMSTRRASAFQILCQTLWLNYAMKIFSLMYFNFRRIICHTVVIWEEPNGVQTAPGLLAGTLAIHQDTFTAWAQLEMKNVCGR